MGGAGAPGHVDIFTAPQLNAIGDMEPTSEDTPVHLQPLITGGQVPEPQAPCQPLASASAFRP